MQTAWLSLSTCQTLDRINCNFLWGSSDDRRLIHLIRWNTVTKNKKNGGLSLRETRKANIAHLAKFRSRFITGRLNRGL